MPQASGDIHIGGSVDQSILVTFVAGVAVTALITWVWSFLFEGGGQVDWTLALVLGLSVGVILTIVNAYKANQKGN